MRVGERRGIDRRRSISAIGLIASAVALMGGRAAAAQPSRSAIKDSTEAFPFGRTDEHDLSASDTSLSPRMRRLIRIGEDRIARENNAALAAFFDPQYRFHGPVGAELDRESLWNYFAQCRAAFEHFAVTRQTAVSDGTAYIACRTRFSGRFVRPFTGMGRGKLEPNGRLVEYRPINIFRYTPDGRLVEEWVQYDVAGFLAQLQRS